jgi:hypothetical protein
MKKSILILLCSTVLLIVQSCKEGDKDDNTTATSSASTTGSTFESGITYNSKGKLTLMFNPTFGAQAFELSPKSYVTAAADTIRITQLTYYVSNVTLTTSAGNKINLGNYELISQIPGQQAKVLLDSIPAGCYTSISYMIGVDSLANSTGVHTGALDPSYGMYWTWSTGYVFLRLKGRFTSQNTAYSFDIGGDGNVMNVNHDLSNYKTGGTALTANINVDVAKFFNTPNKYDLKTDAIDIHSAGVPSIAKLKVNIANAFNITAIQ